MIHENLYQGGSGRPGRPGCVVAPPLDLAIAYITFSGFGTINLKVKKDWNFGSGREYS